LGNYSVTQPRRPTEGSFAASRKRRTELVPLQGPEEKTDPPAALPCSAAQTDGPMPASSPLNRVLYTDMVKLRHVWSTGAWQALQL
jgi:hypothetical protein